MGISLLFLGMRIVILNKFFCVADKYEHKHLLKGGLAVAVPLVNLVLSLGGLVCGHGWSCVLILFIRHKAVC